MHLERVFTRRAYAKYGLSKYRNTSLKVKSTALYDNEFAVRVQVLSALTAFCVLDNMAVQYLALAWDVSLLFPEISGCISVHPQMQSRV